MKCIFRALTVLLVAAMLLSTVQPMLAQEVIEQSGLRFDAPEYAVDGPHSVGVRYFTIPAETEKDRELTASVWYPAKDTEDAEFVYEQQFEPGQIPPFSTIGHAVLDAEPDDSGAPYPLVVYTHALWSMGQEVPYLTEHLASRGYVVISVDHEDNWSTDFGPMPYESLIRRPQEVTREIDFAEELSAPGGDLEGMITTEKVGIGGWSQGGVISVMEAGARMDLDNLRTWCEEDPTHAEFHACSDVVGNEEAMAIFADLDEVPTGLWPAQNDERIAATVRLSGSMPYFGAEGLAAAETPVLLMHGGYEEATDPTLEMGNPYESISSDKKVQVIFDGSGHFTFFSSCEESPDVYNNSLAIGFPTFCADAVWDMNRAHDLINHFTTAFFDAELKSDMEAAAAMAPEAVSFPGIEYQAEGYGPPVDTAQPVTKRAALAAVNDIILYYEVMGEGDPILLLPGGTMCTDGWGNQRETLAREYMVISPDSRAQGRSTDSGEPLTYQLMADDMVALMDHLDIESAHVVGWSDGGNTGLDLAIRYPENVRSLVVTGAQFRADGMIPEELEWAEELSVESFPQDWLEFCYRSVAPNPENLPDMIEQVKTLWLAEEYVPFEGLAEITAPVLVLEGTEPDFLTNEHVEELAAAIPDAKLQWIEGAGHFAPSDKADEWVAGVLQFLAEVETGK